jgi:NAD(P)-dependent dehydrogenase (short-subunit alcohol dehydrogenase family)
MGRQSWMIQSDLGIPDEIDAMFDRLEAEIDHLDILVNNAGMEFGKSFYRFSASEWDQILDVNLRGAFLCSSRAARMMMERQSGTIINMSSIHDVVPRRYFTPYCVSKAGLLMLTRCTALELSDHHIRVNAISPGAIRTDMNRKVLDSLGESFSRQIPWKEVGDTRDVTGAAVFLASDESRYATGTTLYIDGGYRLNTIRNEGEYE